MNKDAPYPPGRNANGFRQKINALKRELQGEFKSIKAGNPIDSTTKPKGTPRKRKTAAAEGDSEESPKKKERAKKNAAFESKSEVQVKEEPEGEAEIEEDV